MSAAWNDWYHVTTHVYGSWLRGDPRGWRARHHREHVVGDYKNPPAPGKYDHLYELSKALMKRDAVRIAACLRQFIADAVAEKLKIDGIEVLVVSMSEKHLHVLARFPKHNPRMMLGYARKYATQKLKAHGLAVGLDLQFGEGIWAKRSRAQPIANRAHEIQTFRYIERHAKQGASSWIFTHPQRLIDFSSP
jgi:REP element-mobilizing transposase RayT